MRHPSVLTIAALAVLAALPASAQTARTAIKLADHSAVQEELKLTEDQIARLQVLGEELREDYEARLTVWRRSRGDRGLRELPEEQRRARLAEEVEKVREKVRKINAEHDAKLAETLTDAQKERLQQIQWQYAGAHALADERIVETLNLTPEQQERITELCYEVTHRMFPRTPPERHRERWEQLVLARLLEAVEAGRLKALEVLTPEQKQRFEHLMGEAFDVDQLRSVPIFRRARP